MATDYYAILGVRSDVSDDEIRAAYRDKAIRYHPDHYGPDSGPFLSIQEAYAVLGDPRRREEYDRTHGRATAVEVRRGSRRPGWPAAEPLIPGRPPRRPARASRAEDVSVLRSYETYAPSFDEILDRIWSNFVGGRPHSKGERIESLTVDVPLSPEHALRGGEVRILVPAEVVCPTCRGHGGVDLFECWRCRGHGTFRDEVPVAVPFPAGILGSHVVEVPLDRLGIENLWLRVVFRV